MEFLTDLPTDSVLRRHAETERNRELGLPPTDSVLRRHHEHLRATLQSLAAPAVGATAAPARPSAAARPSAPAQPQTAPRVSAPVQPPPATRASAPAPAGGGLIGWFRRLLGM